MGKKEFVPQMKSRTVEDLESDSNVVCKTVFGDGEIYYIAKEGNYFTVYDSEGLPLRQSTNHLDVVYSGAQTVIIDGDDKYTLDGHIILRQDKDNSYKYYVGDEAQI